MNVSSQMIPREWSVTPEGAVRVTDVAKTVGNYPGVSHAVRACKIPVVSRSGMGSSRHIRVEDGLILLAAAALALAAGVAISQVLKALMDNGATVTPTGTLSVPIKLPN
jgi:hypothetical protein